MKKHMLVALVVLSVTPGMALAQMMGGGMSGGAMPPPAQQEAKSVMPASGMSSGMTGQGMMSGMMCQGHEMMAEGMMKGQVDLARMRKALALSDDQAEKLRAGLRPFQKEAILTLASLKVAELELADILAGEKVDFGKVEAKLKEIEAMRTKVRLAHLKTADMVKGILSKEQLEKLQAGEGSAQSPAPVKPAPPEKGAAPGDDEGHEQHH